MNSVLSKLINCVELEVHGWPTTMDAGIFKLSPAYKCCFLLSALFLAVITHFYYHRAGI